MSLGRDLSGRPLFSGFFSSNILTARAVGTLPSASQVTGASRYVRHQFPRLSMKERMFFVLIYSLVKLIIVLLFGAEVPPYFQSLHWSGASFSSGLGGGLEY